MSFHLEGPWLTTTGKKKGKSKFSSAEQARQTRELEKSWAALLKKHPIKNTRTSTAKSKTWVPTETVYRRETAKIDSVPFTGDPCVKPNQNVYTGDKMLGVAVMHKSCLQPIFNQEAAKDSANMRRS